MSEEEYAQLEAAAQADGRTLGEWCREAILRGGSASDSERHDPALAEIIGVRLLLVNVLGPVAAGEKVTPEKFNQLLDQIGEAKHAVFLPNWWADLLDWRCFWPPSEFTACWLTWSANDRARSVSTWPWGPGEAAS